MANSTEIIAEYAALLPLWLAQLDLYEAEQRQLLSEMQEDDGAEVIVEEAGVAGAVGAETSVWEPEEELDPVAWLAGTATTTSGEGATPPEALGFDAPERSVPGGAAPSAPPPTARAANEEEAVPSMFDRPGGDNPILDESTLAPAPRGNEETNLFAHSGDDPSVASIFEQNFGETHTDFLHALRALDEESLPWDLRETLRYATTQEEIAAAFVKTQRDGLLDEFTHLEEAVREMTELDYHFRDAAERYDTPGQGDDPILPLF